MKRLNRKGFTLVELLAIIVILAIILVITVPQVFKAVDNSKRSALESSAASLTKWYNTTKAADALMDSSSQILGSYTATTTKTCLPAAFFTLAEVSATDYNVGTGAAPASITDSSCSHYYKNASGNVVFVLVAKTTGKLYMGTGAMWAASDGTHSW